MNLSRIIWHGLPAKVGRASRTTGVALADGAYLSAWPPAALAAPAVGFAVGALVAATQSGPTFTYSVVGLALLAAVAGVGAGVGCFALLGYIVVNLASGGLAPPMYLPTAIDYLHSFSASLIAYLVLATLLVLVPLAALVLREEAVRLLRVEWPPLRPAVHAVLFGLLVLAWAQAAAFLIRPVWSFHGRSPDVAAIEPLQHKYLPFVLVAAVVVAGRGVLETYGAGPAPDWLGDPPVPIGGPVRRWPVWASVPARAVLLAGLLAGLLANLFQAAVVLLVLLGVITVQVFIGRVPPVGWLADRVPLIIRIAAAALITYWIATSVVEPRMFATSFVPVVVTVTLALLVAAVLLPQREA